MLQVLLRLKTLDELPSTSFAKGNSALDQQQCHWKCMLEQITLCNVQLRSLTGAIQLTIFLQTFMVSPDSGGY